MILGSILVLSEVTVKKTKKKKGARIFGQNFLLGCLTVFIENFFVH